VHNYSVYASEDVPTAFVYLEVESEWARGTRSELMRLRLSDSPRSPSSLSRARAGEKQWAELQTLPVMKRWLSLSAQQVKADKDGEAVMHRLSELFHLE
jgi:L-rhamnose mutarotase